VTGDWCRPSPTLLVVTVVLNAPFTNPLTYLLALLAFRLHLQHTLLAISWLTDGCCVYSSFSVSLEVMSCWWNGWNQYLTWRLTLMSGLLRVNSCLENMQTSRNLTSVGEMPDKIDQKPGKCRGISQYLWVETLFCLSMITTRFVLCFCIGLQVSSTWSCSPTETGRTAEICCRGW